MKISIEYNLLMFTFRNVLRCRLFCTVSTRYDVLKHTHVALQFLDMAILCNVMRSSECAIKIIIIQISILK